MRLSRKARHFWPVTATVLLADCATKAVAERTLTPAYVPHPVLHDLIQFTLAYNPGGAMSLSLGSGSRWLLSLIAGVALTGLWLWYRRLPEEATRTVVALGLVWAGAAGNLWDRLRSSRGVVDFIDLGFGPERFWTFNLADAAIVTGALLLALSLSRRDPASGER